MSEYDRGRGAADAWLAYFHPLFKVVGITATIVFGFMALWALVLIFFFS